MESVVRKFERNKLNSVSSYSDNESDMKNVEEDGALPEKNVSNCNNDVEVDDSVPDGDSVEAEKQAKNVSIDITKALVILGFSNWSALDSGMKVLHICKFFPANTKTR